MKFEARRPAYSGVLEEIKELQVPLEDLLHYFPAFVGDMTLNRYLTLYELYKRTVELSGHIAEVGVYKGAGSIFFAKLINIFEPMSLTMVHGFDWFKGNMPNEDESKLMPAGGYQASHDDLIRLIRVQGLANTLKIHNLDATKEFGNFFTENRHLVFKLVFLDAGVYGVVKHCIENFIDRIVPNGILIFDQFAHELAPGETAAIMELLGAQKIERLSWSWMPNAFIVKK
ncbi:class I SAM-dependent methyltransferase [Nitrosospira multiformis]|nr:class I SAM-dependent methyltransferase [Nitrosospira multiformis]